VKARADTVILSSEPSVLRAELRRLAGRMFAGAIAAVAETSQRKVAHTLGVSKALVARWCDRGAPLDRVLALPLDVRRALMRELASDAGLDVTEAASESATTSDLHSLAESLRTTSQACGAYSAALVDGVIDADEAALLLRACDAAAERIAVVRARAKDALEKRGVRARMGAA
jgi:hypothetical protein